MYGHVFPGSSRVLQDHHRPIVVGVEAPLNKHNIQIVYIGPRLCDAVLEDAHASDVDSIRRCNISWLSLFLASWWSYQLSRCKYDDSSQPETHYYIVHSTLLSMIVLV